MNVNVAVCSIFALGLGTIAAVTIPGLIKALPRSNQARDRRAAANRRRRAA